MYFKLPEVCIQYNISKGLFIVISVVVVLLKKKKQKKTLWVRFTNSLLALKYYCQDLLKTRCDELALFLHLTLLNMQL